MHKLKLLPNKLLKAPKKYLILVGVLLMVLSYAVVFREREMTFSYAEATCDRQLVILPGLMQMATAADYKLKPRGGFSVAGQQIIATSLCATPEAAPSQGESVAAISLFGSPIARLSYKISTPSAPSIEGSELAQPIAATKPLKVSLTSADTTFDYRIKASNDEADCQSSGDSLTCEVPELKLKQGAEYDLALERYFNQQSAGTVVKAKVATLSPVSIEKSTIEQGSTVYDRPTDVTLEADKPLAEAEFELIQAGDQPVDIPVSTSIDGAQVKLSWPEELARSKDYSLKARTFEATDGSTLLDPYQLDFKLSGGPKVTGVNVDSTGIATNAAIVISFDQELNQEQDISKLISVSGVPAGLAIKGQQVVVQLNGAGKCQDFTVDVKKGLMSKYDIPGEADWSKPMRTVCHSVSTVGYSHGGRAINAYEFGSGSRTILFVGAIHGNEVSTTSLMRRWIDELEARAREIPADKRIVVVPQINPDGVASGSRMNARGVDLNRNFSTSDWQKDITTVGNQPFPGGGGESAMSEPETKAMAALAARLRPELTLSYHSIGGLLAANQADRSNALAGTYSQLSGYRNTTGQTSSTFEYAISGTWDDYIAEKLGLASILIELGSHSYHQFERNQAAMWAMVKS